MPTLGIHHHILNPTMTNAIGIIFSLFFFFLIDFQSHCYIWYSWLGGLFWMEQLWHVFQVSKSSIACSVPLLPFFLPCFLSLSFLPFLPFFIPFYLHKTYYVLEVAENKTAKVSVLLELTFWWPKTDNEYINKYKNKIQTVWGNYQKKI